jgi:hypothetical protein
MISRSLSLTFALAMLATGSPLLAGPITDGVVNPGEYNYITTLSPYVNGTDGSGGVQNVSLYWATDSSYVYGAVVGDLSQPSAEPPFANVYVYSSGASTNLNTSAPGVYGDGDDILIESANDWGFGGPSGFNPGTEQLFTQSTSGGVTTGASDGITVAFDAATLTEEFAIPKALLGNYDVLRFGGQLFAYEFDTGSSDRVPGALVAETFPAPTPEPSTWMMIAGAMALVPFYRRKKQ